MIYEQCLIYVSKLFKLSDEERTNAIKKFEEHDKDQSGTLDKEELRAVLKEKMPKATEKMVDRLLDAQFQLVRTRCWCVKVTR